MRWAAVAFAVMCAGCVARECAAAEPPREHACFSTAQTREKILLHKLAEPFRVMKSAANRFQAEPIGVKLCRMGEELIYEISLLRRDGHVIHAFVNAASGQLVATKNNK